jgi:hypothetical protein
VDNILLSGTAPPPLRNYVHDLRDQFDVLYDKSHVLTTSGANQVFMVEKAIKMARTKPVNYTAGSVYGRNQIFALLVSDSGAVVHPSVQFSCRLNFTDS